MNIGLCFFYRRYIWIDPKECAQETPNTQSSLFKYADERYWNSKPAVVINAESNIGIAVGNIFYGTDGYLELEGGDWNAFRKREKEPFAGTKAASTGKPREAPNTVGGDAGDHFTNFIDAMRSGKDEDLHCDIMDGHYSAALPHLANISYRLGRGLKFMGDYERFANDPEADTMLRRVYRKPYVVPDEV